VNERVAIIGAGVSGLTCAVLFAERGYRTAIFAHEMGTRITSGAAGAIWFPYDAEPADRVIAWSLRTYKVLRELSAAPGNGVSMIELRTFARNGELEIPTWAHSLGARFLKPEAIPPLFATGFTMNVPLTDTSLYLDYLAARARAASAEIHVGRRFESLEEVAPAYEVIVNCAGIGAQALVPDPELEPHRGQVVLVPPLELPYAIVCDDPPLMYAIPRANDCVFGGTNQLSDDRRPDPNDTASIRDECSRALGITPPNIVAERVGLRPFRRAGICLRADRTRDGRHLIHNYGHGGSGFTLSWGCAEEVVRLATTR
jgi:D-amino-acid oxidase